ncbi:unnamed protein product [Rotaria sp. Silwood2]|nr:unnamed protein product [Rotaria sp. Silwood2]CAF4300395.1 unnamed protein product [Rotaria sp. Silwood2]CAF4421856.1 unnamed protein product [Rotaria sp. Silwood2]
MSRQYSNHSFIPSNHHHHMSSDNSSRQRVRPLTQNDFSYFQYPSQRQIFESNREINNTNHHSTLPFNRIPTAVTTSAYTPHYHFENHNETILRTSHHNNHTKRQRRPSTAGISNSQTNQHHHERKRSRYDGNEREQHNRSYINHRSRQPQQTNSTTHNVPSFCRSFHYGSHNHSNQAPRHFHHESLRSISNYRQSIPFSNANQHRHGMTFESTSHRPPLFHRTSMTTHVYQRSSPSFLITNLLHHVIDTHVHHHLPSASFDLIAYAWMSPSHEIFSLPTAFTIHFAEFFDVIIPDETPMIGLTDSELKKIPTMIYKKTCTNIKDDDKCAICLSEYITDEKLKRLRCKHYFHSECIDPWLKTSARCPICRGEQTN